MVVEARIADRDRQTPAGLGRQDRTDQRPGWPGNPAPDLQQTAGGAKDRIRRQFADMRLDQGMQGVDIKRLLPGVQRDAEARTEDQGLGHNPGQGNGLAEDRAQVGDVFRNRFGRQAHRPGIGVKPGQPQAGRAFDQVNRMTDGGFVDAELAGIARHAGPETLGHMIGVDAQHDILRRAVAGGDFGQKLDLVFRLDHDCQAKL